jgi:hypothetical protein
MNEGERYGRLTTRRRVRSVHGGKHALWECACTCGGTILARSDRLRAGRAKSCGCLLRENRFLGARAAFWQSAPGE